MPLAPCLDEMASLSAHYKKILNAPDTPRRNKLLKKRFERLCSVDPHMQPGATPKVMYYKGLAQGVKQDVIPALIAALNSGQCPEISITLTKGQTAATTAGYTKSFGSPQDFLYGFTSERYPNWSKALAGMGFRSVVMTGSQQATLTMAPRELGLGIPDKVIDELSGAIALDYWETGSFTSSTPDLRELLDGLWKKHSLPEFAIAPTVHTIDADLLAVKAGLDSIIPNMGYDSMLAGLAYDVIKEITDKPDPKARRRAYLSAISKIRPDRPKEGQEQIALKFVQEANLLQKLLGGRRVDHIQSNVKMQKNPTRLSSCEVDSIYRVLGEKAVVLVEAKAGTAISRSQLYQIYETFRLKLPPDWQVIVVTALLSKPDRTMDPDVRIVLDMAEIKFDDNLLGRVTESLIGISVSKHYRWLIHQD